MVDSAITLVSSSDQEIILEKFSSGLPPDYLFVECDTDDREKYWHHCRSHFDRIHDALKAYLSGNRSPLNELPIEVQDWANLNRDFYLALYGVLHDGWQYIVSEISNSATIPDSPGKMLASLLEIDSIGLLAAAFPEQVSGNFYSEHSPRSDYAFFQEQKEVIKLLENQKDLSHAEQQKIKRFRRKLNQRQGRYKRFSQLRDKCLEACRKHSKGNQTLQRKLEEFDRTSAALNRWMLSQVHPSKNPQGWAWNKGERLKSGAGGVYHKA